MELLTTGETRRGVRLDRVTGAAAQTPDTPAKIRTFQQREPADKLTLSRQAVAFVEEYSRKMWDEAREREHRRQSHMDSAAQSADGELDLLSQGLKVLELCQKIAASVMKGDKVPLKDLRFLMENDPDGYRLAMAMRRHKKDPEEVDSVLEDEEKNGGRAENAGGVEAPSGQVPSAGVSGLADGGASACAAAEQ